MVDLRRNFKFFDAVKEKFSTNSVVYFSGPRGSGKTLILCKIIEEILENYNKKDSLSIAFFGNFDSWMSLQEYLKTHLRLDPRNLFKIESRKISINKVSIHFGGLKAFRGHSFDYLMCDQIAPEDLKKLLDEMSGCMKKDSKMLICSDVSNTNKVSFFDVNVEEEKE